MSCEFIPTTLFAWLRDLMASSPNTALALHVGPSFSERQSGPLASTGLGAYDVLELVSTGSAGVMTLTREASSLFPVPSEEYTCEVREESPKLRELSWTGAQSLPG